MVNQDLTDVYVKAPTMQSPQWARIRQGFTPQ